MTGHADLKSISHKQLMAAVLDELRAIRVQLERLRPVEAGAQLSGSKPIPASEVRA